MTDHRTSTDLLPAIAVTLFFAPLAAFAAEEPASAIELGAPFSDNAILQREADVPVWGWSRPGTSVTVEFAVTLRERERLSADLHDTLEQTLTGVALQIHATRTAATPEGASRNLELATAMLSRSR